MRRPAESLEFSSFKMRRWRRTDIRRAESVIEQDRDHLAPWLAFLGGNDAGAVRGMIGDAIRDWDTDRSYRYAITSGKYLVGSCGIMRGNDPGGVEIGYWLHRNWTGRGIATTAVGHLIDVARQLDGIHYIEIRHDAANHRSEAIPRRLGFEEVSRTPAAVHQLRQAPGEEGIVVTWRSRF